MGSNGNRPTWSELLMEFRLGATRPSIPAIVGCLFVTISCFLACFFLLGPNLLVGVGKGYFFESPRDEYAYLSVETLRLQKSTPGQASVFYFGASAMREAISSGPELKEILQDKTHLELTVHNLTAGGLTLWEMIALVDNIPADAQGVVVLPISPITLTRKADRLEELTFSPRLALHSESLNEERRRVDLPLRRQSGNFFRDNYKFFLARFDAVLLNLIRGPIRVKKHLMDGSRPLTPQEWERALTARSKWIQTYGNLREINLVAYEHLLKRLDENPRLEVLLIAGLWNPRVYADIMEIPDAEETYQLFLDDVNRIKNQYEVTYLDSSLFCDFKPSDFVDTAHITNKAARRCYTEVLADMLANIFVGAGKVEEGQ